MSTSTSRDSESSGKDVDGRMYRGVIGSLIYLTASRPDIMFNVCKCARFQSTPKESHLASVKRIIRYLIGTQDTGLWYPCSSHFYLIGYSETDFIGDKSDRKSTCGTCQILGDVLISWHNKKQNLVALSTTEAKYIAVGSWGPRQLLNFSIPLTFVSKNLNKKFGIYYDELQVYASYKGQQITLYTSLPPFYQGHEDSKFLSALLIGNGFPVDPYFGYEVQRDQSIGKLIMKFKGSGRLRWKVGAWVSWRYRFNVDCVAVMPFGPSSPSGPLSFRQGAQCSTTIEVKVKYYYKEYAIPQIRSVVQKKGRTYRCGFLQSFSSSSLFPNPSSTLQTMEEIEAMRKQIVELTQQCAANDAKFAKFEELAKKHMPQVFHDGEESEPDDN
ncbi:hypothetical protein BC332_18562 [Capsicum chinense]|nr:hypothetical protein BC332_18562 [Capsicum chinense]